MARRPRAAGTPSASGLSRARRGSPTARTGTDNMTTNHNTNYDDTHSNDANNNNDNHNNNNHNIAATTNNITTTTTTTTLTTTTMYYYVLLPIMMIIRIHINIQMIGEGRQPEGPGLGGPRGHRGRDPGHRR